MNNNLQASVSRYLRGGAEAESAAREIFDQLWTGFVRHYEYARLPSGEAQEVASEAVFKVLQGLKSLHDQQALMGWIRTVRNNALFTHLRRTSEQRSEEVALDEQEWEVALTSIPDHSNGDPATLMCLRGQLEKFEREHPDRSSVLYICVMEAHSMEELSKVIGRTVAATKEYLSQCRKCLRVYLLPCLENER